MGSAIALFDRAAAVRVPRSRFLPVKKCQDLLGLWSDAYRLSPDYHLTENPARDLGPLTVRLDETYYKKIDQLKTRFPHGAPSLVDCISLDIKGDVHFGKEIKIEGKVAIRNEADRPLTIEDGSKLTGDIYQAWD